MQTDVPATPAVLVDTSQLLLLCSSDEQSPDRTEPQQTWCKWNYWGGSLLWIFFPQSSRANPPLTVHFLSYDPHHLLGCLELPPHWLIRTVNRCNRVVASLRISHRRMLWGMKEEEGNHLIFTTTGSCLVKFQKRKARRLKNHSPPSYYHGSLDSFVLPCEHIQNPYAFFRSPSDCTLSLWVYQF